MLNSATQISQFSSSFPILGFSWQPLHLIPLVSTFYVCAHVCESVYVCVYASARVLDSLGELHPILELVLSHSERCQDIVTGPHPRGS